MVNIVTVLSLAELGFSQAIAYLLYKPLAEKNDAKAFAYIRYFKRIYLYIGAFVIIMGIVLLPFLESIIPTNIKPTEVKIIFLLFIANSSITYFWSYKRTLIIADQKNYKIIPAISLCQATDLILKSIFLFIIRDFIFILCLQVVIKILENFLVNNKINKLYATVFSSDVIPLNNTEKETIKRKTIATFYHKLGTVFVNSTDSIIISAFVGVSILGVYSNYTMVITLLTTFISVAFNSTIASFGNLIIEKKDKSEESFYIIQYTSIFIFGLASLLFLTQINSVISLWIGDKYNISYYIVILLTINFFIVGIRTPVIIAKTAGGIFEKDKYAPILEGILSLILALLLVQKYDIIGVLMAKLISVIVIPLWLQPYITFNHIFSKKLSVYLKKIIPLLTCALITIVFGIIISHYISTLITQNGFIPLVVTTFILIVIYTLMFLMLTFNIVELKMLIKKLFYIWNSRTFLR
ncbi:MULTISPECIES: hypothetical protein [Providencia]|nr:MULTISPECIES: hypothetical protein [Providencia]